MQVRWLRTASDVAAYDACLSGQAVEAIRRDMAEARTFGIRGTPTFLFGTLDNDGRFIPKRRESGAIPFEAFAAILEQLIAETGDIKSARGR